MSDWPTDAMVDAYMAATYEWLHENRDNDQLAPAYRILRGQAERGIPAALQAAPAADGWVWCEHTDEPAYTKGGCFGAWGDTCPGPPRPAGARTSARPSTRRTTVTGCSHDITDTCSEQITSASVGYQPPCEDCRAGLPYGTLAEVRRRRDDTPVEDYIPAEDIDWDDVLGDDL